MFSMHTKKPPIAMHLTCNLLLAAFAGCGNLDPAQTAERPSRAGAASIAPLDESKPSSEDPIADVARSYVTAISSGDAQRVDQLASAELRARIAARGPAGTYEEKLRAFTQREREKLLRVIGQPSAPLLALPAPEVEIRALQLADRGLAVAVSLSIAKLDLQKPLYLIKQGTKFAVNVVPPLGGETADSASQYRVENDDYGNRSFSCSGHGPYAIGPHPTQRLIACQDSCRSWFFDGTTFKIEGAEADCDYNTWGVDMYIRGGYPICNDPC